MNLNKDLIKSMSFGLNEQLIMLSSILAGLIGVKRSTVIFTLILISLSNSLPDTISYYQNSHQETNDASKSMKIAGYVFMTEMIVAVCIILPIILIPDLKISIIVSYLLAILICYLNLLFLMNYNIRESTFQLVIYILIIVIIFTISKLAKKYFKINI